MVGKCSEVPTNYSFSYRWLLYYLKIGNDVMNFLVKFKFNEMYGGRIICDGMLPYLKLLYLVQRNICINL